MQSDTTLLATSPNALRVPLLPASRVASMMATHEKASTDVDASVEKRSVETDLEARDSVDAFPRVELKRQMKNRHIAMIRSAL